MSSQTSYLIWQYREKPNAKGTANAILSESTAIFKTLLQTADLLDIDNATGYALDLVGKHVGVNRVLSDAIAKEYFGFLEVSDSQGFDFGEFYRYGDSLTSNVTMNDDDYRFFIKCQLLKNYQDGTVGNIVDAVYFLLGDNSNIIDKQNMNISIILNGNTLSNLKMFAIKSLDIIPRPVGVRYDFLVITNNNPFGFYEDNDLNSYGFDKGEFITIEDI